MHKPDISQEGESLKISLRITPDSEATLTLEKCGDLVVCSITDALTLLNAVDRSFPHFGFVDAMANFGLIVGQTAEAAVQENMELTKARHGCAGADLSVIDKSLADAVVSSMCKAWNPYRFFYEPHPLSPAQLEKMAAASDDPDARQRLDIFTKHIKVDVAKLLKLLAARAFWDDLCEASFGLSGRCDKDMQVLVRAFQENLRAMSAETGIVIEYPGFTVAHVEDSAIRAVTRAGIDAVSGTPVEVPFIGSAEKPS